MGKNSLSLALAISTTFTLLNGNTIDKEIAWTSGNITCNSTDTTCTVNCAILNACAVNNGDYGFGPHIHCPTIQSCTECNIKCSAKQSCSASTIHGYECDILNIDIEEKDNKKLIMYAPDGGSLNVLVTTTTSDAKLTTSYIYAGSETKNIYISCENGREFKENVIDASTITGNLTFLSGDECKSDDSSFVCPSSTPCSITCSGGSCETMSLYSPLGTHTMDFVCGIGSCAETFLNCDFDSTGTTDCSMSGCSGPCVLPPTYSPTVNPTLIPTFHPTHIPTNSPTNNPTFNPTLNPSLSPTHIPTNIPISTTNYLSTHPSNDTSTSYPSSHPTLYPTIIPTNNPSFHPSFHPTIHPSSYPALYPSTIPTNIPTNSPTDDPSTNYATNDPTLYPTAIPTNNRSFHPTFHPTHIPTYHPSILPSAIPTVHPSLLPTYYPSMISFTDNPTITPTFIPSMIPTYVPSIIPTFYPSTIQSSIPTYNPSLAPSNPTSNPSSMPSSPTYTPTYNPSSMPSSQTYTPTYNPSSMPSYPTYIPTQYPNTSVSLSNTTIDDNMLFLIIIGICMCVILCLLLLGFFGWRKYLKHDDNRDIEDDDIYNDDKFIIATMTNPNILASKFSNSTNDTGMNTNDIYGNRSSMTIDEHKDIIINGRKVSIKQKEHIIGHQQKQPEIGMVTYDSYYKQPVQYYLPSHSNMHLTYSSSVVESDGRMPIGSAFSNVDQIALRARTDRLNRFHDKQNIYLNNESIPPPPPLPAEGMSDDEIDTNYTEYMISDMNISSFNSPTNVDENQNNNESSSGSSDDSSSDSSSSVNNAEVKDDIADGSEESEHSTSDNNVQYDAHQPGGSGSDNTADIGTESDDESSYHADEDEDEDESDSSEESVY